MGNEQQNTTTVNSFQRVEESCRSISSGSTESEGHQKVYFVLDLGSLSLPLIKSVIICI